MNPRPVNPPPVTPPMSSARHANRVGLVLDLVRDEAARARILFPGSARRLAALVEEAGEVATALMDLEDGKIERPAFVAECVQLAAMAVRLAVEGEGSFPASLPEQPFQPR